MKNVEARSKRELKAEINDIESDLNQNDFNYDQKEIKTRKRKIRKLKKEIKKLTPELIQDGTYSMTDFIDTLAYSGKKDTPMKKWFKNDGRFLTENEASIIKEVIGDEQAVYNYFEKTGHNPHNILKEEVSVERTEVESNNIYDTMAAPQTTEYIISFKIQINFNESDITIYHVYKKDTTLSMRDIASFM